jgi:hypothetical protein
MWLTVDGVLWHQVPGLNHPGPSEVRTVCGLSVRRVSIAVYASNAGAQQIGDRCTTCNQHQV